ncbi:MAG: mercuric transport protein MerTP [Reichenbachiella sp.]|uniref:mercuric transport protein MerTP n=1 Tax=Reichenbachiella sp. TaxID=2184521 RepID=UPI003299CE61
MSSSDLSSKSAGAGLFAAIVASLCCITPVFSLLVGISGIATTFSWMEPFRPYLIVLTFGALGFAWYQKLKQNTAEQIDCACEDDKPLFWQSKKFLSMVTVFAAVMLAFPYYADVFYPDTKLSETKNINSESTYEINISGMTCTGCEEHLKLEIGKLPGISGLEVSYEKGNAVVTFDETKTDIGEVKLAVSETGYKVESVDKSK